MRNRAYTLVEITIYCFLAALVMTAMFAFFQYARVTSSVASAGFALGQDEMDALRGVRRDLQETSLQSLRSFPGQVAMVSARDDNGVFQVSQYGVPQWSRYVVLALEPGEYTCKLIRFEVASDFSNRIPQPAAQAFTLPSSGARVLSPNVLAAGFAPGMDANDHAIIPQGTAPGGLTLGFVRADGSLSALSPNQSNDNDQPGWTAGTTDLVELKITLAEKSSTRGKWSVLELPIRVAPRH